MRFGGRYLRSERRTVWSQRFGTLGWRPLLLYVVISDIPGRPIGLLAAAGRYTVFIVALMASILTPLPIGSAFAAAVGGTIGGFGLALATGVVHDHRFSCWLVLGAALVGAIFALPFGDWIAVASPKATRFKIHYNSVGSNKPWRSGRLRWLRISMPRRDPSGDGSDPAGSTNSSPFRRMHP
jgi:hypothetical protein